MSKTYIPEGYKSELNLYQTQTAIGLLKRRFEKRLCLALNLKRVSAPLSIPKPDSTMTSTVSNVPCALI